MSRTITDTLTDTDGRDWTIGWTVDHSGIITTFARLGTLEGRLTRDGLTADHGLDADAMQEALEILAGIAGRGGGDVAPDEDHALAGALSRARPSRSLPPIGTRVVLRRDVERFPHFVAPRGATGTVVQSEPWGVMLAVELDEPLAGAESWDNEVLWQDVPLSAIWADIAPIMAGGSPWASRLTGWHPNDCPCRRCAPSRRPRPGAMLAAALVGAAILAPTASAASARIAPTPDTGRSAWVRGEILLAPSDACVVRYQSMILGAYPGAPIAPLERHPVRAMNACREPSSTLWEDGSVTARVAGPLNTSGYVPGKHYVGLVIWTRSRAGGSPWSRHAVVRSFWHRYPANYSAPADWEARVH